MSDTSGVPLGLVAGNGRFPLACVRAALAEGKRVVVAAHEGETDKAIEKLGADVTWVKLGQVGRILDLFEQKGVGEAVMLGGITKTSFFAHARPDVTGMKLLAQLAVRSDDNLLRGIARLFEERGIRIVASTPYLSELKAPRGVLGRVPPTAEQWADVRYGFELAKGLGRYDVGQTVVVKERAPIALEAIEGTDACISRGGQLAKGAVVVKVVKPGQDERFDLPAAGPRTVESCRKHGLSVLALEAGGTLLIDREEMVRLADKAGIALVGVDGSQA
ncbi:MAG: hypothetical protein RL199_1026 [Pseudomonadota bacterium]